MSARILVVDDTPANVRLLEAKLSAEYYEVLTATDGPSALAAAAEHAPDLILLDVMMPGMDGFEVAERLKADPVTRHIPVVIVTALNEPRDRVRGLEAGADDFLSKPLNDVALFARVRSLTRLKVMMDELRLRRATTAELDIPLGVESDGNDDLTGRILLADDGDLPGDILYESLTEADHQVYRTQSSAEAIEHGRTHCPDLIIVGETVGEDDGLRLCSQLRSHDATRHVPILLVLEADDLTRLAKGLDLGVNDYLSQPIDRNELLARTRTQIRHRRYHLRLRRMLDTSVSLAYTDSLTGVYNRRYMYAHLGRSIAEMRASDKPVSLLLFDIDRFKDVNDLHGHAAGDSVLRAVAQKVTTGIRDSDLLARYGGEEFVVIMPGTLGETALAVAERVRGQIAADSFAVPGRDERLHVTVSIGVATASDPNETAEQLMRRVDDALYRAKEGGRNRVCAAEAASAPATVRRAVGAD